MSTTTITAKPRFKRSYEGEVRSIITLLSRSLPDQQPEDDAHDLQVDIDALPGVIQRYYKRRLGKIRTRPRRAPTAARPYASNDMLATDEWHPKHPEMVELGFAAIRKQSAAVFVKCPHTADGGGFSSKLMVSLLSNAILTHDQRDRAAHMRVSLSMTNLCARLVAVSNELIRKDERGMYSGVKMVQHTGVQTTGWQTRSTKGAGVALNRVAESEMFDTALNELERRFRNGRTQGQPPETTAVDTPIG